VGNERIRFENSFEGTPCAVKVACTVWTKEGGKKLAIASKPYLSVLIYIVTFMRILLKRY